MSFLAWSKLRGASKRLAIPIAFSLFAVLFGLFENVGYCINASNVYIDLSNSTRSRGTSVYNIYLDTTFNPILHPFQWLVGQGHVCGNMSSMMLYGASLGNFWGRLYHAPGTTDRSQFPGFQGSGGGEYVSPSESVRYCVLTIVAYGLVENAVVIFVGSVLIEALHQRFLYGVLLAGTIGFIIGGVAGVIIGLVAGTAFYTVLKLVSSGKNPVERFLNYILERDDSPTTEPASSDLR